MLEGEGLVPYTSTDKNEWKLHTDRSLRALAQKLRRSFERGDRMQGLEQIHGYRHLPFNILADETVTYEAMDTLLNDWMHTWCIDGAYARAFSGLMNKLANKKRGDMPTIKDIHDYIQRWRWPRQLADPRRIFESGSYNSGVASETLSAAPVLSKFFQDVVAPLGNSDAEIRAFVLACDCLATLQESSRGASTPQQLEDATKHF